MVSGFILVNATEMAKPFSKQPSDWVRLYETKRYIRDSAEKLGLDPSDLVVIRKGEGTWIHEDLVGEFTRWLNIRAINSLQDVKETYLIFDDRYYKIGESTDSHRRLKTILTANPSAVLLAYGKGVDEKTLHEKYKKHRISGEWFELSKNQVSHIIKLIESK